MTSADAGGDESGPDWALSGRILYSACGGTDELLILVSARAVVTLPSTTPLRVHSLVLAELDAPGLSTETVVQSIPLLGEDCVDSFSVVVIEPELRGKPSSITVVVRGAAAVDVHSGGGSARVSSQGLMPWHLVTFGSVGAVVVGTLPEIPSSFASIPGPALPLGKGAVRGLRGVWQIDPEFSLGLPLDTALDLQALAPSAFDATRIVLPESDGTEPKSDPTDEDFPHELPRLIETGKRFEIRLGDGAPIELLRPIVIGRNPRPPRISAGQAPAMLRVESGSSRVSGSHIEIAKVGESVVVTDLASTNGTTVTLPDGSQIKLRQGDSLVTPVQSKIDVGDGNVFEVLQKSV